MSFLAPRASKGKLKACEEARASGDTCCGKSLTSGICPGEYLQWQALSVLNLLPIDSLVSLKTVAQLSTHAKLAPDSAHRFTSFYSCGGFNSIKFQMCV
jgi:hypothetical protein